MRTGLFITAAALAGGAAIALAAGAAADAAVDVAGFSGSYAYLAGGGGAPFATTWNVTPCGSGCVHIVTTSGLTDTNARLVGNEWVFDKYDELGIRCDNDKVLPATVRFSVNPDTGRGTLQPQGDPCGGKSRTSSFTLTKIA